MANYMTLQSAIDSGTINMSVLRSNVKNDNDTVEYTTGISWFYFNSVQVSSIFSSGNSWIGFGSETEQLLVNRQDCAVWYEWSENGNVSGVSFFKFRWCGYSQASSTSDSRKQEYDIFLFENGQIFLNFYDVPTSQIAGTKALICGAETITFPVSAGVSCEFTFTPTNRETGTGWGVSTDRPVLVYSSYGYTTTKMLNFTGTVINSNFFWTEEKPEGTDITISISFDNEATYTEIENGGPFLENILYTNQDLFLKIELSSSIIFLTPFVYGMGCSINTVEDANTILLETDRFRNVFGGLTISYGGGNLMGEGGPVSSFSESFSPIGLTPKPDQHNPTHISISNVLVESVLMTIYYTNVKSSNEHLEITTVSAAGVITSIDDI